MSSACSRTPFPVPWNSNSSVGLTSYPSSFEYWMHACICSASRISMRATGMPICIAWITVLTADLRSGYWHTAAEMASGMPYSRSWISVMTPSVPSDPTKRCVRS